MRTVFFAALLLVTTVCFAQAPQPSFHQASSDVYFGYMVNVPTYSGDTGHNLQGFEAAYTLHLAERWGVTLSGGVSFGGHTRQEQVTVGPRFNLLTGRFRPYLTGQFGGSNQDSDQFHLDKSKTGATVSNVLTFRAGGGADYQLTPRFYWRLGQWAAQPVPWGRHSSSLFQNFSTGIGFQF
jgi:hypothetical protein